ncbi:hypothetical protein HYW72_00925 [Candidatus Nomurabacteria bacterium]|nr:hypothetical protein [Candidatus Nomurabacteria bacterium]
MQDKNNKQKRFTHQNFLKKISGGFTIIETMIAISLFLVVVMSGMNALLNANLLHQKSGDMRSILDNLSFIMEDMSRNLRTGYDYYCILAGETIPSGTVNPRSCTDGVGISFKSATSGQWVYYVGNNPNSVYGIFRKIGAETVQLTPNEVVITSTSLVSVLGAEPPPGNSQQPFVTIRLVGKIILKNNVETPFSLQTSVSQRLIDVI